MIRVSLKNSTESDPVALASYAAQMCYQAEPPEMGRLIDVEKRLFLTGHHTTLQHTYFTFEIEGISVGDITFGLHLCSPFYNSDQRSGRFCAKMFLEPDYEKIMAYVRTYWPCVSSSVQIEILNYLITGVDFFHDSIEKVTETAVKFIKSERPFAGESHLKQNAQRKIAQEQLRMLIPVIFPTGLVYTINLSSLVALYECAWTPAMKDVVSKMVKQVLEKYPALLFMFREEKISTEDWGIIPRGDISWEDPIIKRKPEFSLVDVLFPELFVMPSGEDMHPLDKLHFLPKMMDNSVGQITSEIEISVATMGQDQRHRTIGRSMPSFNGHFYVPPLFQEDQKIFSAAKRHFINWSKICQLVPKTLGMVLAPYGAMVRYKKRGSFNAIAHEQGKRLCWCAQEEIYHLARLMRQSIKNGGYGDKILSIFEPPCYEKGFCLEGDRYCGRNMIVRLSGDYFPERIV